MLGLGSCISNSSNVTESADTRGLFSVERTFISDATQFYITFNKINHEGDTNTNDSDPGIKLSELSIKVNGTEAGFLPLDSSNASTDNISALIAGDITVSNGNLTIGETAYYNSSNFSVDAYMDTDVDSTDIAENDEVVISGRVTLNDGTGDVYVGENAGGLLNGEDAKMIFTFSTNSSTQDVVEVYIDPVNATVPGSVTTKTRTQVSS